MINISLIIPFYNEQEAMPSLIQQLSVFISEYKSISIEIILIDDGSKDNSVMVLKELFIQFPLKIIRLSKNFGSHAALRAGILHAQGEVCTFNYCDLQDPLNVNIELYDTYKKGFDVVWGSRRSTQLKGFDKIFSKLHATLVQTFINPLFPKNGFDIVLFNRKIKERLNYNVESNSSIFLQILTLGFNQTFIYYDKRQREFGVSKWTLSKKIKILIDSFIAFSYAPIRFVSIIGILFFVFGIIWTVYILSRKMLYNDLASGWPALTSILLLGFGITNIGLGIIAEYLWRTLDVSRKRPVFIIDEIIELNVN